MSVMSPELLEDGQALARLLGREDVLELLEPQRRAVAQVMPMSVSSCLYGQRLEPSHVLFGEMRACWSSAWRAAS
jgi:hypothetical protein